MKLLSVVIALLSLAYSIDGAEISFRKLRLTDKYYCDGVATADINQDGHVDIIGGPFWYEGPSFTDAHAFYKPVPLDPKASPSNSMFSFTHDFSGDGLPDILVLGRVHKHEAKWYENPGVAKSASKQIDWTEHFAFPRVRGESPTLADLNGDGTPQLICHWEGRWGWIQPNLRQPSEPWEFTAVGRNEDWPQFYHGQGVGDINGDGLLDIVINDGWYEQPAKPSPAKLPVQKEMQSGVARMWRFHRSRFSQQRGGAQMFAFDIDADGDNDVVSAKHAHEWGLAWYENMPVGKSARFREHTIMGTRDQIDQYGVAFTQPHAMCVADVDGDGLSDLITGKRRWAHGPDGDIEPNAPAVVVVFLQRRYADGPRFAPVVIDQNSGVGVQVQAEDVNRDGRVDIITASKLGTFVFFQNEKQ